MILVSVFINWMEVTRGPMGIPGIPQPVVFGWQVNTQMEFLALAVLVAVIAFLTGSLIVGSPFGRVLHAIREDEVLRRVADQPKPARQRSRVHRYP
jgi:branched-chain amino acid transport system permease protein